MKLAWRKSDSVLKYGRIIGLDPTAIWLLGPGRSDYLRHPTEKNQAGADLIPFTLCLHDEDGVAAFQSALSAGDVTLSPFAPKLLAPGQWLTAFALIGFFDDLATKPALKDLKKADKILRLAAPLSPRQTGSAAGKTSGRSRKRATNNTIDAATDEIVVKAIIDDGIAFANQRFRDRGGLTRFHGLWLQDGAGSTKNSLPYGAELTKAQIDSALSAGSGGRVDEVAVYRDLGLIDFAAPGRKAAALRRTHGTAVLDLFAGAEPHDDTGKHPLIGVQLPLAVTQDSSGSSLTSYVIDGIDYILDRAQALVGPDVALPRIVINLSYGTIAGSHDGTGALEMAMEERISASGGKLQIVLPSGNSQLSRCHAAMTFSGKAQTTRSNAGEPGTSRHDLFWRVMPDDRTPSFLEIWLPCAAADAGPKDDEKPRLSLRITAPDGIAVSDWLDDASGAATDLTDAEGNVIATAAYHAIPSPTARGLYLVALQPTARLAGRGMNGPNRRPTASGVWTVSLRNHRLPKAALVQAWIQRDDSIYGYPQRGRQGYFDHPDYQVYTPQGFVRDEDPKTPEAGADSLVKRRSLVSPMASGPQSIVAGGYIGNTGRSVHYSAAGPLTPPCREEAGPDTDVPDAAATTDDSLVHAGVPAAGTWSGSVVIINGTSMAAPQVARWLAEQWPQKGTKQGLRAAAAKQDAAAHHPDDRYPDRRGAGRLNVIQGLPVTTRKVNGGKPVPLPRVRTD